MKEHIWDCESCDGPCSCHAEAKPETETCDTCGKTFEVGSWRWYRHEYEREHLDDGKTYIEKYKKCREMCPGYLQNAFDELIAQNKAPRHILAGCIYADTDITQQEAADAFDTTTVTVRQHTRDLVEIGAIEIGDVKTYDWSQFGQDRNGQGTWRIEERRAVRESD